MAQQLRNRVQDIDPDCMKEVCEQIADIKRVVNETKKRLTKEQKEAVRAYRHSMLERIQAVDEKHQAKEKGQLTSRIKFMSSVFEEWDAIASDTFK